MTSTPRSWPRPRLAWWAAVLALLVLAVNAASIWEIAVALRAVREEARRALDLETAAVARGMTSALAATRTDLTFLAGVLPENLEGPGSERAGAALLLFLRGHDPVTHLRLRTEAGPIVEAGRPRGVPGYWVHGQRTIEATEPPACTIRATVPVAGSPATVLEGCLGAGALLDRLRPGGSTGALVCALTDATGRTLPGSDEPGAMDASTARLFEIEGWEPGGPWTLACAFARPQVSTAVEPLVARQRVTVLLNLVVMGLAGLLGWLAFAQARKRQQIENRAREEARVRQIERQLLHAERLSTVGRLAAGLAHEINNPLEGMANYLRLAREALARGERGPAERQLGQVDHGLSRVAAIARRVLDRAERGGGPEAEVDLRDAITEAIDFVRVREEFSAIRFELDLGPRPARVRGNPVTLGQVFLNLALNACEAQPGGGEVIVHCHEEGASIVAEVLDRGAGVPAAARERIFEPFESTKRSLGLGLSTCRSIVVEHEGTIEVGDRPGGGAVFRVRLPRIAEVARVGA